MSQEQVEKTKQDPFNRANNNTRCTAPDEAGTDTPAKPTADEKSSRYQSRRKIINRRMNMINGKFKLETHSLKKMDVIRQNLDDYGKAMAARFKKSREHLALKYSDDEVEQGIAVARCEKIEDKFLITLQSAKDVACQGCVWPYSAETDPALKEFEGTIDDAKKIDEVVIKLDDAMKKTVFDDSFPKEIIGQYDVIMDSVHNLARQHVQN
jgi:hypothetical protein